MVGKPLPHVNKNKYFIMNIFNKIFTAAAGSVSLLKSTLPQLALPSVLKSNFSITAALFEHRNIILKMHQTGPRKKVRPPRKPLDGNPFLKGVILKTLIKKPKKPNSANRKCVLVRLSNGKEMVSYVPGIGHNLQEHQIVLCRVGRLRDVPGVKLKCVRGKYDLPHVKTS